MGITYMCPEPNIRRTICGATKSTKPMTPTKAIANTLPARGEIELLGKPLCALKRRDVSLNIAMLSQQPTIYFAYSVFNTVMMGRYLHIRGRISDSPIKEDKDVVIKALEAVNLLSERDKDITKLSGGQLQRVFLARALAQEPKIILLDEPTNHLDLKCQIEIIDYLKQWAKEGNRAVVGVLHDINLAMNLSSHFVVMKDGIIKADGDIDSIITSGLLNEVYEMEVGEYMKESLSKWSL